jgi:phosphatidate cytidylyltransferase
LKEIHKRTVSGILYVIILTGSIFLGPYFLAALFLVLSIFVLKEFYSLGRIAGYSPQIYPGLLTGAFLYITSFLLVQGLVTGKSFLLLLPILFSVPVYELYRKKTKTLGNIAVTIFGMFYVSIPFSLLNFLVFPAFPETGIYDPSLLIILFIIIWTCDSGAYLFGVKFGHHRLFERISPKKSWEGFFGGFAVALIASWILSLIFIQYDFLFLALIATITVVAGTLGDLVESMFKRQIGIKDSGRFMPGHGGLLDRFDSILLSSPFIYFIVQFLR